MMRVPRMVRHSGQEATAAERGWQATEQPETTNGLVDGTMLDKCRPPDEQSFEEDKHQHHNHHSEGRQPSPEHCNAWHQQRVAAAVVRTRDERLYSLLQTT